jgi:hypothetical protein
MITVQQFLLTYALEAALVLLGLFVLLFILFSLLRRPDRPLLLRPIPAYERLRRLTVQSIETGRPMHVSMGSGEWSLATPELVAGLIALDYVGREAARADEALCATTGNPVTLLLAMNVLQLNLARAGNHSGPAGNELYFYGPDPLAYVSGSAHQAHRRPREAHALVGNYADEGLWLAEALQPGRAPVLGGTSNPTAVALMHLSVDESIIGEDLFAAGAYLHRPRHLGSLAAQDVMRFLLALAIVAGAILASLGLGG